MAELSLAPPRPAELPRGSRRPSPAVVALPVLAALVFWAPLPLAALGALGFILAAALAPVPALGLIVLSLPFSPLTRPVGRYEFSPTEILIVLCGAAYALRLGGVAPHPLPPPPRGGEGSRAGDGAVSLGSRLRSAVGPRIPGRLRSADPSPLVGEVVGGGGRLLRGDPILAILLVAFVVVGAISLTASVARHESLQSFRVIVVEPALFYVLAVNQVRDRRGVALLALALVAAGVAIALVGEWQYLTNQRIITAEEGLRRIRGFYGSPNNLGLFLGRALPLGAALALWWERGRWLLVGAVVVMGVALVLTFSIGAWIAVGLSLLVVAATRGRRVLSLAAGAAILGLVVLVVVGTRVPRIGSHFEAGFSTSFIRLSVWQSALHLLRDHPLRGVGLDNFLYYYQHGYRLPDAWQDPNLSHPHNLILDFWLSLGLPGLLVALALFARFAVLARDAWREADALAKGLIAGAVGALADTVLHGMIDNSFFLVDLAVLFWLTFAIVSLLSTRSKRLETTPS